MKKSKFNASVEKSECGQALSSQQRNRKRLSGNYFLNFYVRFATKKDVPVISKKGHLRCSLPDLRFN